MPNIIAIVGRPNVGKSTLFNRLIKARKAIMDDASGITRDRHYGHSEWNGKHFTIIDTGGYVTHSDDIFEEAIRDQVQLAMDEASLILFMVDIDAGITGLDKEFAKVLRQNKKPIYVVANKADTHDKTHLIGEFYKLGMKEIFPISSANGQGTGDLLDAVVSHFDQPGIEDPHEGIPRLAILGRPNAGKSSLVNALIGKERAIVTDIAGTTRDSIKTEFNVFGQKFLLVDTAGIRKKSKVTEDVEFYSVLRSIRAIEESDVCIVMIDAERGLESQDLNILKLAQQNKKGILILINKWDLIEKNYKTHDVWIKEIKQKLAPHDYIPIMFVSATEKIRIVKALEKAIEVNENRSKKISTSKLNDVMLKEIERYPPPSHRGKHIHIKYITQLPTYTPTFAFFSNFPNHIKEPYERFLMNRMRENFNFEGVPIKLVFRKK